MQALRARSRNEKKKPRELSTVLISCLSSTVDPLPLPRTVSCLVRFHPLNYSCTTLYWISVTARKLPLLLSATLSGQGKGTESPLAHTVYYQGRIHGCQQQTDFFFLCPVAPKSKSTCVRFSDFHWVWLGIKFSRFPLRTFCDRLADSII